MHFFRLRSLDDYKIHVKRNEPNYAHMRAYEAQVTKKRKRFTVRGISYPAGKVVDFRVDYQYSDGVRVNWRERLICPETLLNNRLRCSLHVLDAELGPYPDSSIYITEQVTPMFAYLKKRYPGTLGSEYLGPDIQPGAVREGIRHEDMTRLSFEDGAFGYYLSYECFEHIPAYQKAIPEIYRVLGKNGVFLGTFPYDLNAQNNLLRATLDEAGNIVHHLEPEYHGDPVSDKGILCYTVFGWEILEEFRAAGFRDVYVLLVWSDVFGYLGGEQVYFVAKK